MLALLPLMTSADCGDVTGALVRNVSLAPDEEAGNKSFLTNPPVLPLLFVGLCSGISLILLVAGVLLHPSCASVVVVQIIID